MCYYDKTTFHKRNKIKKTQLIDNVTIEYDGLIIATHTQRDCVNYSLEKKFTEDICKKTLFNYIKNVSLMMKLYSINIYVTNQCV